MKITKLIVKNFAPIFTAMGKRYVEIDMSGQKNRIILLIGLNGTGKTTILSLLNPNAYPGTFDVRNGKEFILENEDGYKEIHYSHNGSLYIIKHHYLFKNDKGIKSFISKDGVELNPNGNSNSFHTLIQMELSVEPDFFRLLRLGSNVAGFIDMKAGERKVFMGDLMKDVNMYIQLHKKVSEDSRLIKSLMRSIITKITKLKVINEKEELRTLEAKENSLVTLRKNYDNISTEIGRINGAMDTLIPQGFDNFNNELKSLNREYSTLNLSLVNAKDKLGEMFLIIHGTVESTISNINTTMQDNENSINVNKSKIEFFFNQLNSLNIQKEEKESNLRYISSELEYDKLKLHFMGLNKTKTSLGKKFKDFKPMCNKDEMLRSLAIMQEINQIISSINDYNQSSIRTVVDLFINRYDVDKVVREKVSAIDDDITGLSFKLNKAKLHEKSEDTLYVLYVPEENNCECPYKKYYDDHQDAPETESERKKLNSKLLSLEDARNITLSFQDISKKIEYIFMVIKSNADLVKKVPDEFFNITNILNSIRVSVPFYDEDHITNYISLLEEYDTFIDLDRQIQEAKKEMTFIEKNGGSLVTLQSEVSYVTDQIIITEKELDNLKIINLNMIKENNRLSTLLDEYIIYQGYKEKVAKVEGDVLITSNLLKEQVIIRERILEFLNSIRYSKGELLSVDSDIKDTENEINDIKFRLKEFKNLTEEKRILDEWFDEIDTIREALSSNKGIPLLFIQVYLKNTKNIINQLLGSIYNGELEIDELVINEKEFRIPYIKKGITVSDASYCSQGERTFISLALSFALIEQSFKEYNIMLLDEIDATLHIKFRQLFISILERQLDVIDAEQTFVITHNNMFDNYPVDVIMTSDEPIENYKNINILCKTF